MGGGDSYNGPSWHTHIAQDQSLVQQGYVNMPPTKTTRGKGPRKDGKQRGQGSEGETAVDEELSTTEASGNQFSYHLNSNDPLGPARFYALRHEDAREGDIFRIWKENNDIMHLNTVVILRAKRNLLAVCKINRCIPRDSDHHFRHHNAEVKILRHPETSKTDNSNDGTVVQTQPTGNVSANLPPVDVIMDDRQRMEDNCWLNLERSFDMGVEDNYKVVYCGKLTAASRRFAKERYRQFMNDED